MSMSMVFLMILMNFMAIHYIEAVKWSPLEQPKTRNSTWPFMPLMPDNGSKRDELSQKSNFTPMDDEILFRRADKFFSKFMNTAILKMFLQILVETVESFVSATSDKRPELVDVEIFERDSPHFLKETRGEHRVKRSPDSFLSTTIWKIWDFIKSQVLFVMKLVIPSPVFKLLEAVVVNLVVPLQKVFDLIRSLIVHMLQKSFSDPHEDFEDDLNKIMRDFTKRLEELLKSSKNFQ